MKFEISFNESNYRSQNILHFQSVWKKSLKLRNNNFFMGLAFVLLGIFIIIDKGDLGFALVFIGLFMLNYSYKVNRNHKSNKNKYLSLLNKKVEEANAEKLVSIWELHDDYFYYNDPNFDSKMKWKLFSGFRKIEDTLFLDSDIGLFFILSENEIGSENFSNLVIFLRSKLPEKIIS